MTDDLEEWTHFVGSVSMQGCHSMEDCILNMGPRGDENFTLSVPYLQSYVTRMTLPRVHKLYCFLNYKVMITILFLVSRFSKLQSDDNNLIFGGQKNKERNGETPLRTEKYFE